MSIKSRIPQRVKTLIHKRLARDHSVKSYSQCGEDLILNFAFSFLKIPKPTYLDVGAHHPEYLSNTALFYKRGSRGVNVEPDQNLFTEFKKKRSEDVNLNIGLSDKEGELDFYFMSAPELNTFDKEEAERLDGTGNLRIIRIGKVKVEPINKVLNDYFPEPPDLLSMDVEGLDLRILKTLDFEKHAPLAICVETLSYRVDGTGTKNKELLEFLCAAGYFVYADTYINTIFFERERFERLLRG